MFLRGPCLTSLDQVVYKIDLDKSFEETDGIFISLLFSAIVKELNFYEKHKKIIFIWISLIFYMDTRIDIKYFKEY